VLYFDEVPPRVVQAVARQPDSGPEGLGGFCEAEVSNELPL